MYSKVTEDKKIYIVIYVNGDLIYSNDVNEIKSLKNTLLTKFKIKDVGEGSTVPELKKDV